jgi:hypothetical protein
VAIEFVALELASDFAPSQDQCGRSLVTAKVRARTGSGAIVPVWVNVSVTDNTSSQSRARLVFEAAAEKLQQRGNTDHASLQKALDDAIAGATPQSVVVR